MKSVAVALVMIAVLLGMAASVCVAASDQGFSASVTTEGLPFPCVAGATCTVVMSVRNTTGETLALGKWAVSVKPAGAVELNAQVDPAAPTEVKSGETATAQATITLPATTGGRVFTLVCSVQAGNKVKTAEFEVPVTPQYEVTLLPTRLILGPDNGPKTLGVSVINHTDKLFEGKIEFTSQPGIKITPAEVDAKIDPLGLEPYMLTVKPEGNLNPGHYTMWMDVAGKAKDWAMIDVPAVAKKMAVKVDGKLGEWQNAQSAAISCVANGKALSVGKARFARDAKNFYIAIEVNDTKHVLSPTAKVRTKTSQPVDAVVIAIDPLINGAKSAKGGYRDDDREYTLVDTNSGVVALQTGVGAMSAEQEAKLPVAFRRDGTKSIYELAIPWSEMSMMKLGNGKMIAVSIQVQDSDGKAVKSYSFGGGIAPNVDPRLFVPIVISE